MANGREAASRAPQAGSPRAAQAILALVVTTQLMIVLDSSIVNLSLTALRADLGVSPATLAWIVNAYALTFGGLLLLGGRLGDGVGRRTTFVVGVSLFAAASLVGGLSSDGALLIGARALQGTGAALAAPSALSILLATFPEGVGRTKALGLFVAMAAAGGAIGLLLGGILTSAFSWRAGFMINVPVGAAVVVLALRLLPAYAGEHSHLDVGGAATGTLGVGTLIYAMLSAGDHGWTSAAVLCAFVIAAVLLTAFVAIERRVADPLLPLRLVTRPRTAAAYGATMATTAILFGISYLLPQYLQVARGFSAIQAGVAFLPAPVLILVGARGVARLTARFGARRIVLAGLGALAVAGAWLTQLSSGTHYVAGVLGPLVLMGAGGGLLFLPLSELVLVGVPTRDAGAASGALQTAQQAGGALGVALLASIFTGAAGSTTDPALFGEAAARAFTACAVLGVVGLLIVTAVVRGGAGADGPALAGQG